MKNYAVIGIVFVGLFAGCTKSSTGPGGGLQQITSYPTSIGSSWSYEYRVVMENFRPSVPGASYSLDTTYGSTTVIVTRPFRLASGITGDSITSFEFQQTDYVSQPYPASNIGYQYFTSDSSGLHLHGYRGGGGLAGPLAVPERPQFLLNGSRFNSVNELINAVLLQTTSPTADSLMREIPPLTTLRFPLVLGSSWIFRQTGHPWKIEKAVLSDTTLFVSGISYHCYKVRWIYDMDNNGVTDQNVWIDDYIAHEGLLRRTINFKDIMIATAENPDGIGLVDSRNEYIGTSVIIH